MGVRGILKRVLPDPVRRLGWRAYYHARNDWLGAIIGCRTTRKTVALTFDDGPNPDYTPPILEILAHYQVKATFFMLGRNVATYAETARDVAQTGHAVGNHTFTHPCLVDCNLVGGARELFQCQRTIREVIGIGSRLMRPPFGDQDLASFLTARTLGFAVVNWSVSGDDWQGDPASVVAERVMSNVRPGGIILLHDGLEPPACQTECQPEWDLLQDRSPTIEALPMIIEPLRDQGYEFVTVPEMIRGGSLVRQYWFA